MLTSEILSVRHTENIKFISEHGAFPFVFSGCGMRSLKTCTHVILMPKSHTHPTTTMNLNFEPELLPTTHFSDENVEISGTQKMKGNYRLKVVEKLTKIR